MSSAEACPAAPCGCAFRIAANFSWSRFVRCDSIASSSAVDHNSASDISRIEFVQFDVLRHCMAQGLQRKAAHNNQAILWFNRQVFRTGKQPVVLCT